MTVRVGFIADLHFANHRIAGGPWQGGLNRRGRQTVGTFGKALSTAAFQACDYVVAAGDVFDTTRPEPQLIAAVQVEIGSNPDVSFEVILGNHDQDSSEEGDHALGPLSALDTTRVYEKPDFQVLEDGFEILYMPFMAGAASEWFPRELDALVAAKKPLARHTSPTVARVLVTHLGVHDQKMRDSSVFAAKADDAIAFELLTECCLKHGIQLALAGNWHGRTSYVHETNGVEDFRAIQIGTLCPTGWDNPGLAGYGSLIIVEAKKGAISKVETHEIPGPRFVNVVNEIEFNAAIDHVLKSNDLLYVRWNAKAQDVDRIRLVLEGAKEDALIEAYDIKIDKEESKLQAVAAAQAARSATTLDGVLGAYVANMALAPGVNRDAVFTKCHAFLK